MLGALSCSLSCTRQHDRCGVQRQPHVRLLARALADEAARRHADDRRGASAHRERLAEDVGPAGEAPLPVGVADDRARRRRAVVFGAEDTANGGTDAEYLEESVRHQTSARFLPGAAIDAKVPRAQAALRRHQRREDVAMRAQLFELTVGQPLTVTVGAKVEAAAPRSRLVGVGEHDQLLGLVHGWKRRVEDAVPQAEDGGVGADAKRERNDGDEREPRRGGHRYGRRSAGPAR